LFVVREKDFFSIEMGRRSSTENTEQVAKSSMVESQTEISTLNRPALYHCGNEG
jgi:hypothetical protein